MKEIFTKTHFTNRIIWIVIVWFVLYEFVDGILILTIGSLPRLLVPNQSAGLSFVLENYTPLIVSCLFFVLLCLIVKKNRFLISTFKPSREGKSITDSFKKNTDDELAELKTIIQSLKDCAQTLLTLDESIKNTLTEINQMRQEVAELKQALMDSQGSQDTVLSNIQESINALSQKDEQAFSNLSKSLESSKEAQIALMNGIKENLESLSKNQEKAFSGVTQSIESVRKEQETSFSKIGSHLKSDTEKTEHFVDSIMKENHLLRILSIVNIALVVCLTLVFLFK